MPTDEPAPEQTDLEGSDSGFDSTAGANTRQRLSLREWLASGPKIVAEVIIGYAIIALLAPFLVWFFNGRGIENRLDDVNTALGEASVTLTSNQTELATLRDELSRVERQLASAVDRLVEADESLSAQQGRAQDRLDELRLLLLHLAVGDPQSGNFADIEISPHKNDIRVMAALGIIDPCEPARVGTEVSDEPDSDRRARFCPDDEVLRGVVAQSLVRLLRLDPTGTDFFKDDKESPWESSINALAAADILLVCGADSFCPYESITREEVASWLVKAFGLERYPSSIDAFIDDDSSIYEEDINRIATAAVTRGCNPPALDEFCPRRLLTRGEWASFLQRSWLRSALPVDS